MTLLVTSETLAGRRAIAAGPLAPLAQSLAEELRPLLEREVYFPTRKALLSREGGRCARDGTLLDFDPFRPHEHRCPKCGEVYRGELHDRFWIYWYQLWLAERAVHASLFTALGDDRFAALARAILDGYVERYETYPNVDNVLGPTRLFFSTYLEAIWLLQICIATDLLDGIDPALAARVRDRIIEPSRRIIAEYDEGASNRQVWNDAALFAAARLLGDQHAAEEALFGRSGIVSHLENGLLADGTWYEGENYHLFAHRGLWYGVTMAERAGMNVQRSLIERFQRGFAAPLLTALPDYTLPSRRDSQYAISLRQWRIAEHIELGLARERDPMLVGALARLYGDDVPRRDTRRRTSSADVERNAPSSSLARADMSWRGLLCALPELPPLERVPPSSALLDAQGIAVFRRDHGRGYVALDYGHPGGGHGHPDRLNLLVADADTRWLDDFGTGSYVDPTLHWYRSTLAHNAPLVDGHSQDRVSGELLAHDERGGAGWIAARVRGIAPGVDVERTLVVMPSYVIDLVAWRATRECTFDLPLHADATVVEGCTASDSAALAGGSGVEDGFNFVDETAVQLARARAPVDARAMSESGRELALWASSSSDTEWWLATAPGPPGHGEHRFRVLRTTTPSGEHQLVWSWLDDVASVAFGDGIRVALRDGTVHEHRRDAAGWHVRIIAGTSSDGIELGGCRGAVIPELVFENAHLNDRAAIRLPAAIALAKAHYRRSEESWNPARHPTARLTLDWREQSLRIDIDVRDSDRNFAPADAVNRYDNEPAAINGDGVQLYLETTSGAHAWMLVPERGGDRVRVRPIAEWGASHPIVASWRETATGYAMSITVPFTAGERPTGIDVIVNEMPAGRERRRGQLVLSGAHAEFVYLRGDRHDPSRLLALQLPDA